MNPKLQYKDFHSPILFEEETQLYHGQIEGIPEEIKFKAPSHKGLRKAFEEAVEDYLFLKSVSQGC
ncbi:MAG: hypothetical protein AAF696_15870 [Bacteroidota bacterium]